MVIRMVAICTIWIFTRIDGSEAFGIKKGSGYPASQRLLKNYEGGKEKRKKVHVS
jgi:hypothetical protein